MNTDQLSDYIMIACAKYADFSGRARRAEFWYFSLIINVVLFTLLYISPHNAILVMLLIIIPAIAISTRRLHDINKSGWWQLLSLVPFIGGLILLYWYIKKGDTGPNQYGPDPLQQTIQPPAP